MQIAFFGQKIFGGTRRDRGRLVEIRKQLIVLQVRAFAGKSRVDQMHRLLQRQPHAARPPHELATVLQRRIGAADRRADARACELCGMRGEECRAAEGGNQAIYISLVAQLTQIISQFVLKPGEVVRKNAGRLVLEMRDSWSF